MAVRGERTAERAVRRIGVLLPAPLTIRDFRPGSRHSCRAWESGWTVGRNVLIDTRWATGDADDSQTCGGIGRACTGCYRGPGTSTVRPLLQTTRMVPIVFPVVADPVGSGLVASLARPGGNATGFMTFEYGMSGKWLELLKEIVPGVTRVAIIRDATMARDRPVRRHPGRGAVAPRGRDPGRRARRRRDRTRRRGLCAPRE